ncbi:hypothetical protein [Xanthobacter agilis]|uniref:Uncharacterized protein n=1 Tax=Xanthobacter agilis TaxID=47492 RepID=A0ABU0LJW5_XANAG|nr:hypothetical protein [Xanthobacter agilis]MDQ0507429.1 hypothetical protein [Xanthobacter agilis]
MNTIYLRFPDRAEALATLSAVLGFDGEQDAAGRQLWSLCWREGARIDLCFLADAGVGVSAEGDHVNLLCPDDQADALAADLAPYVLPAPATPDCRFA